MSTGSNVPGPPPADPSPSVGGPAAEQDRGEAGEKAGLFQAHAWMTPVVVVVSIVVLFVAMIVLTWGAGGGELFGG
ncbi:hypothetical protein [Modestobacter excelsi]|uniref:hypothetical protein n=1 Tax=Modestobacter excelsi TaxID=2213161 RepID=UPI00110CC0CA|nr:hypothetical protein [Modestobacter excelsi]